MEADARERVPMPGRAAIAGLRSTARSRGLPGPRTASSGAVVAAPHAASAGPYVRAHNAGLMGGAEEGA
jgi:hypothetical protein